MDIGTATPNTDTVKALEELKAKPKKAKKVKKPAAKKKAAPKKKAVKKSKVKKPAKKAAKRKAPKKVKPTVERFERLDMRLSRAEKAKITAKAKKLRRTITSVVLEAIEKIK